MYRRVPQIPNDRSTTTGPKETKKSCHPHSTTSTTPLVRPRKLKPTTVTISNSFKMTWLPTISSLNSNTTHNNNNQTSNLNTNSNNNNTTNNNNRIGVRCKWCTVIMGCTNHPSCISCRMWGRQRDEHPKMHWPCTNSTQTQQIDKLETTKCKVEAFLRTIACRPSSWRMNLNRRTSLWPNRSSKQCNTILTTIGISNKELMMTWAKNLKWSTKHNRIYLVSITWTCHNCLSQVLLYSEKLRKVEQMTTRKWDNTLSSVVTFGGLVLSPTNTFLWMVILTQTGSTMRPQDRTTWSWILSVTRCLMRMMTISRVMMMSIKWDRWWLKRTTYRHSWLETTCRSLLPCCQVKHLRTKQFKTYNAWVMSIFAGSA